ncbi:MAG: hypothetical protein QW101_01545 [Ignisphaera sp.]|uniref:Uncharacterized protein n=1 Tax=Ignisphaera aggregans TaxID=334771 RepID=A0A7J3MZA1_9CREN
MSICRKYVVKVGDKEINLDEKIVKILNTYVRTETSLEKLAEELGLDDWDEAYEFIKKVPAWIMWTPSILWKKEMEKCSSAAEIKIVKI